MDTNLFCELLQVALGTRDRLSRVPSVREWEEMEVLTEELGRQELEEIGFVYTRIGEK